MRVSPNNLQMQSGLGGQERRQKSGCDGAPMAAFAWSLHSTRRSSHIQVRSGGGDDRWAAALACKPAPQCDFSPAPAILLSRAFALLIFCDHADRMYAPWCSLTLAPRERSTINRACAIEIAGGPSGAKATTNDRRSHANELRPSLASQRRRLVDHCSLAATRCAALLTRSLLASLLSPRLQP